jgi:hypothetical protein
LRSLTVAARLRGSVFAEGCRAARVSKRLVAAVSPKTIKHRGDDNPLAKSIS